jgi:uncharacterized membrane protein
LARKANKLLYGSAALLAFLGFVDAAYLTVDHYLKLAVPCSLTHGCETVLTSQYATIQGVPIALPGAIYYLVILLTATYLLTSERPNRFALQGLLGITAVGLAVSAYLFYLQIGVIHAICQYCIGSAITTTLLFTIAAMLVFS